MPRRTSRASSRSGARTSSDRPARATSTSSSTSSAPTRRSARARPRRDRVPRDIRWRDEAPHGKLDLLLTADFRMTSTTLFSDIVLPAATWYEKHDLSSTDMHPFIHAFNPAIAPPWQTRTDFDMFGDARQALQRAGGRRTSGVRRDIVASPLQHDTADVMATPHGRVRRRPAAHPRPDDGEAHRRRARLPEPRDEVARRSVRSPRSSGMTTKGDHLLARPGDRAARPVERARRSPGPYTGVGAPRHRQARLRDDPRAVGHEQRPARGAGLPRHSRSAPGSEMAQLAEEHEGSRITFADVQVQPRSVITSPEWSGSEHGGRRYTAFAINVEHLKPWHTLTGRQHFFLDHDWMEELGENLPIFRPPLDMHRLFDDPKVGATKRVGGPGADGQTEVDGALPHAALEVVDPLRVPGQPLHALALARRPDDLDEPAGCRQDRRPRQRLDRVVQPQRRRRRARDRRRTGCRRARCTCTTRRTAPSMCRSPRRAGSAAASTTPSPGSCSNRATSSAGYAQLAWAFNYLGPTGNQRDEITTIRRRSQEVEY